MTKIEEEIKNNSWYKTSRSSGSGGQNVNKVETKVELVFDLNASDLPNKTILIEFLKRFISSDGMVHVTCEESRSQLRNKEIAFTKLSAMIKQGLLPKKKRKSTKPTKSSQEKRIQSKKNRSELKLSRKKPNY